MFPSLAHYQRHAQNVLARVSINERTPFQSFLIFRPGMVSPHTADLPA